jgi:hypothetical protein
MQHISLTSVREKGSSKVIPIKVNLLLELLKVLSQNQKYLEYLDNEFSGLDKYLVNDLDNTYSLIDLLELQIDLGIKYAK